MGLVVQASLRLACSIATEWWRLPDASSMLGLMAGVLSCDPQDSTTCITLSGHNTKLKPGRQCWLSQPGCYTLEPDMAGQMHEALTTIVWFAKQTRPIKGTLPRTAMES